MAELKAPSGKTRVIVVDLFSHEDSIVDDYDTAQEAFEVADKRNEKRECPMDSVYYVYDDQGNCIRDDEAVSDLGVAP